MTLREEAQPQVLDLVGVLVFIDQDIFEALLVAFQDLAVGPQDVEHMQQQVAEIASVERLQPVLVKLVEFLAETVGVSLALRDAEVGGIETLVLPPIDQPGEQPRRPTLFIEPFGLDQLLQDA